MDSAADVAAVPATASPGAARDMTPSPVGSVRGRLYADKHGPPPALSEEKLHHHHRAHVPPPLAPPANTASWSYRLRHHPWAVASLAAFTIFVDMVVYSAVIPILPDITINTLGLTTSHTGILVGVYAAGLLVFTPVFGYWSDTRQDRRLPVLASLAGLAVSSALFLVCTEFWQYLLVRILQGVAAAGNWTVSLALASDVFPADQLGVVMGFVLSGMNLGYLFGPAIGGVLYGSVGHRAPFIFFAVLSVVAIAARLFVDETYALAFKQAAPTTPASAAPSASAVSSVESSGKKVTFMTLIKARPVWVNALAVVVTGTLNSGLEPVLPPFLSSTFGTSVTTNGLLFLAVSVPGLVTAPLAGHFCDRYSGRLVLIAGLILTAIAAPLMAVMPTLFTTAAAMVFFGAVFPIAVTPPLPEMGNYVNDHYPQAAGQVYSVFNVAYSLSMFIGPIISGTLYDKLGLIPVFAIFAGLCVVMAAAYLYYDRTLAREELADTLRQGDRELVRALDRRPETGGAVPFSPAPPATFADFYYAARADEDARRRSGVSAAGEGGVSRRTSRLSRLSFLSRRRSEAAAVAMAATIPAAAADRLRAEYAAAEAGAVPEVPAVALAETGAVAGPVAATPRVTGDASPSIAEAAGAAELEVVSESEGVPPTPRSPETDLSGLIGSYSDPSSPAVPGTVGERS
ncbi:hypothetical protein H9P43_007305 [Blastocladiella emersonii ATCC 22665]|nr:hypothetical protein H9P43_007305 [Blastocladiella emersonii ATCC 22665]